ncbi:CRISPR-associated endoribonuclease Cas2 [Methanosarcinaceae archaeon Ag5]|uniref:CRISPR-associated endoribonuclease Cas2 n=1 Tax=Methanolapillus africanus TaxID=3028297 RepID=A0AAE4ML26_9EURY|nr:CRISPR-associated endoribonuclease Cas2 [Methanosarcinaceae archaeon Ag5]
MYVVIVYDVNVEYVNKVRIFLKQYLNWVQNSVFEGELTEAEYNKVMNHLEKIIDKANGHVLCYISRDKRYLKIDEIGIRKAEINNFL